VIEGAIHWPGILLAYAVITLGVISPGPAVMAIMGTALEKGRRPAVVLASGVVCGSAFWGITAAAGLSVVLSQFGMALVALKIIGGMYMLWLAWKSLRIAMNPVPLIPRAATHTDNRRMLLSGLLIHLTNPKGVFGWLATISVGMTAGAPAWVAVVIVAGGVTISAIGHIGYAILFSTAKAATIYTRMRRGIQLSLSAVFGAAGLSLLTTSFERTTP